MRLWCLGVQPFGVGLVEPACQTVLAEVSYLGSGRLVAGLRREVSWSWYVLIGLVVLFGFELCSVGFRAYCINRRVR
jgi:hypothetical protein